MKELIPGNLPDTLKWLSTSDPHSREIALRHNALRGVEAYIIMGAILCKARDEEDWKKAQCNSFYEWTENEERISRTQAQRMMEIWTKINPLIERHYKLITQIPFTNLYELARIIHLLDDQKQIEMMHSASHLNEKAFKNATKEVEGKPQTDNCDHINLVRVTTIVIACKRCGYVKSRTEEKEDIE